LRLEHLFQTGENVELAEPAIVDLNGLFSMMNSNSVTEMTLGGNQALSDAQRLHWNTAKWNDGHDKFHEMQEKQVDYQVDYQVDLQPMQIRTFLIESPIRSTTTTTTASTTSASTTTTATTFLAIAMALVKLF
jgi:lysosomal alpha-mannosidase